MPIIAPKPESEEKVQFRLRLKKSVYDDIESYCEWANIKYKDYFIEQACMYIFQQDQNWQDFKKSK